MTDARIIQLNKEAENDAKSKLELISDIFRVKKQCFGAGINHHKDAIEKPGEVFDYMYGMSVEELEILWSQLCAALNAQIKALHNLSNYTFLKPNQ